MIICFRGSCDFSNRGAVMQSLISGFSESKRIPCARGGMAVAQHRTSNDGVWSSNKFLARSVACAPRFERADYIVSGWKLVILDRPRSPPRPQNSPQKIVDEDDWERVVSARHSGTQVTFQRTGRIGVRRPDSTASFRLRWSLSSQPGEPEPWRFV